METAELTDNPWIKGGKIGRSLYPFADGSGKTGTSDLEGGG